MARRISLQIFGAIARMRPGVTPAQVAAEGTARARAARDPGTAALALFGSGEPPTITATPALDVVVAEVRPAIRILLAAVLLLFATAVASVATVQLARVAKRRREMTVRAALGASTARLARQWLTESAGHRRLRRRRSEWRARGCCSACCLRSCPPTFHV